MIQWSEQFQYHISKSYKQKKHLHPNEHGLHLSSFGIIISIERKMNTILSQRRTQRTNIVH